MKINRRDDNILPNARLSNSGFLRQHRNQSNSYTQILNNNQNSQLNAAALRSLRGRVENRNQIQQHTSAVNIQNTIKRGSIGGQRDHSSEQTAIQQQMKSINDQITESILNQVGNQQKGNIIHHQRSQSLQKIKNFRDNSTDSPLKKITNLMGQQNGQEYKGYNSLTGIGNIKSLSSTQRFNYKEPQDLLKNSNQNANITKFQDIRDIIKGATGNLPNGQIIANSQINCNQIEFKYNIDPSKKSNRQYGIIKAYAANTNMGIFRNYNEDRVSIILSISKPFNKQVDYWPKTSYFAIYDGHGGSSCSDFLRDNLHLFIVRDENFPQNPTEAIKKGIQYAEQSFLATAESNQDRSGSCAIIVMILDDIAYTVNIGDSRAIISQNNGQNLQSLSIDHKPEDERQRIEAAGGKVYQSILNNQNFTFQGVKINPPHRVFPGKLSVSRTIGDYEAKIAKYGGNPNVIISDPDIVITKINSDHDFILIGCDGVFDRLNTNEVGKIFWNCAEQFEKAQEIGDMDIHQQCGNGIESVMKETFERKSLDNITLVAISFENFEKYFQNIIDKKQIQQSKQSQNNINQGAIISTQNQNIIPSPLSSINNNNIKIKQLHRNLSQPNQLTAAQQTYLFPKVSPKNGFEVIQNFCEDTTLMNQANNQLVSPSRIAQQQSIGSQDFKSNPASQIILQTPASVQNQTSIKNQIIQNQIKSNLVQNQNVLNPQNLNLNSAIPNSSLNQIQYNSTNSENYNLIQKSNPLQDMEQYNKGNQKANQSNSLNRHPSNQDLEGAYFHNRNRVNTPSTIKKNQQNIQSVNSALNNFSNTQLSIENSRLALQSAQSLQILKTLQQDKLFLQFQQRQQKQISQYQNKKK